MQINLLSPKSAPVKTQSTVDLSKGLPLIAISVIIVSILATLTVTLLNYTTKNRLETVSIEIDKMAKVEETKRRLKQYQAFYDKLRSAENTIKQANPQYFRYLDALTKTMPASVTLTGIEVSGDPWKMVVSGEAASHHVVAQMGEQIQQEVLLQDSKIDHSTLERDRAGQGYQFSITIQGGGN